MGTDQAVLPHHQTAATAWGRGGKHYDDVSFAISDALAHGAQRLNPRAGERILDVATGTGWSARNVARVGAVVIGVDISEELLAAARELSAHVRPPIEFQQADAERLPFDDGAFDGVISTFGVMFAFDHAQAAAELARVCRPGGRLALTTWAPAGAVAEFFGIIARHSDAPPPPSSPLAWGDPPHVEKLLGKAFDLKFEPGVSNAYHGSAEDIWNWYTRGFGPLRQLAESLPPDRLERLKCDLDAYHQHYAVPAGLHVKREYLLTLGRRR
ncbi:class I SAM-dependent methyltransferase [Bradyrhizobium lablabi]|uniref:class I SAM-dependent methyltransferase n=1 Tax=Bradyrhizobium lablabi TaxID=722472 RepID=UPI001BA543E0|nr:methyltransferase domain-containing protein [Bradyrhizobium lablabi]MBR0692597.1 class I SAM-dependent methyltransferase [Bradyrhizobium lablabi]